MILGEEGDAYRDNSRANAQSPLRMKLRISQHMCARVLKPGKESHQKIKERVTKVQIGQIGNLHTVIFWYPWSIGSRTTTPTHTVDAKIVGHPGPLYKWHTVCIFLCTSDHL